ncbi:MAG: hypothetical protein AABY22_03295 [Nanoarchaeota archaeon]
MKTKSEVISFSFEKKIAIIKCGACNKFHLVEYKRYPPKDDNDIIIIDTDKNKDFIIKQFRRLSK